MSEISNIHGEEIQSLSDSLSYENIGVCEGELSNLNNSYNSNEYTHKAEVENFDVYDGDLVGSFDNLDTIDTSQNLFTTMEDSTDGMFNDGLSELNGIDLIDSELTDLNSNKFIGIEGEELSDLKNNDQFLDSNLDSLSTTEQLPTDSYDRLDDGLYSLKESEAYDRLDGDVNSLKESEVYDRLDGDVYSLKESDNHEQLQQDVQDSIEEDNIQQEIQDTVQIEQDTVNQDEKARQEVEDSLKNASSGSNQQGNNTSDGTVNEQVLSDNVSSSGLEKDNQNEEVESKVLDNINSASQSLKGIFGSK